MAAAQIQEQSFVDPHGVEVFSRWWTVPEPEAVVVVAHGASDHSGRYDRFARALNEAGFSVVAIDHRGHGRTASSTGCGVMGPGGGRALIEDLHILREQAASAAPGAPVLLFGHSMGSMIALGYLTVHAAGLAGAVLCGVPADVDDSGAVLELLEGIDIDAVRDEPAADLLGAYNEPFEPGRTVFDWLSRDPDEVDRYIADPFCGNNHPLTFGYLVDIVEALGSTREHLHEISCPVLVIAGDQDPSGAMGAHPAKLADVLRAEGVSVDLRLYEGGRHEILNETNRDEVTADVADWFRARVAPTGG